jgi:acyl carrier protein
METQRFRHSAGVAQQKGEMMDIESRVKKIVLSNIDVAESVLQPDAKLRGDLGATSIDMVEIVASLESEFDIEISDEDAQNVRTFGEIVAFVKSKTA